MKIIGITGGIASGKSTATNYICQRYEVIDCDKISHDLYNDYDYIKLVINTFGTSILIDGKIDKHKIRELTFSNTENLKKLNSITYPLMFKEIDKRLKILSNRNVIFIDAPTLFESNLNKFINFDEIWLIAVSKKIQIKRLKERNPDIDNDTCYNILNNQLSLEIKLENSDKIFWNEGSLEELYEKINRELLKL